jgi:hypothetical protein
MERILTSRQKKNQPENDPLSQALNSFMMKDSVLDPEKKVGEMNSEEKLNIIEGEDNEADESIMEQSINFDYDESMQSTRSIVSP